MAMVTDVVGSDKGLKDLTDFFDPFEQELSAE